MATYSQFTLTFTSDLVIGDKIVVRTSDAYVLSNQIIGALQELWVNFRSANYQVTLGTPTATAGERSAINYVAAFALDFNAIGVYEIVRVLNVVTIKSTVPQLSFYDPTTPDPLLPSGPYPALPSGVTLEIDNFVGDLLTIDSVEYLPATTNPVCTHYKVRVTTSILAEEYEFYPQNIHVLDNTDNPFEVEILRGQGFALTCNSSNGQSAATNVLNYNAPMILSASVFDVQITNSPTGATVLIFTLSTNSAFTLEYSLDNATWQESNVFTGLAAGSYTVYVRDSLGCSFTQTFTISEFGGARIPYFRMPKSNSIRFSNRVTWGDCGNYKTDENTLSCEADVRVPYKQILPFQSCDVTTTQFESNYATNTMKIIKSDGSEVNIPVLQMTSNMGLKDRRDARKYNLGNGKTGIYFTVGNIYDYDTGVDIGDYALLGDLPEYANISTYIKVDDAWFVIEETFFDESVNADVIVITNTYTGVDVLVQVSAIYDLENFEEYEGVIDFVDYIDENLQVQVNADDDDFTPIVQLSEVINVKVRQVGTLEIRYKNRTNTDMNFSRGLENKIRVFVEKVGGIPIEENTETSKTDTTVNLLSGEVYEADQYTLSPVTKQRMRQIILALSHTDVFLDGIPYVKNDSIEVEGPLEDSNLYDIVAVMIKSANAFNSNSGQGDNTFNQENIELPGLIETDSGYVRY